MPVINLGHPQRRVDIIREKVRHIRDEVIPRSEWRIDQSDKSLTSCALRQQESTQRLVEPVNR